MNAAAVPIAGTTGLTPHLSERFAVSRVAATTTMIVVVTALAFGLRAANLSTYGFSEDEINKVRAVEAYRSGRIVVNAEHPMLMKLAMLASVQLSTAWNHVAKDATIPIETAVRLPNAIVGAATTAVIFALGQTLFGPTVAIVAAAFWAVDVNAIAINRIGKEDTFALFFFLAAVWLYESAKKVYAHDPVAAQRWYAGSGAAFGLMLASKYFPHYLGVYAVYNVITDRNPGENRPHPLRYYGVMLAAFLVTNVLILEPATWRYMIDYVARRTVTHHGYPFAAHLYANTWLTEPNGIPATFYLWMLATKVPVVLLAALVPGAVELVRRRHTRGAVLLLLWGGLFLIGYSLSSVKFIRYALPLFAIVDLVAAVGVVATIRWLLRTSTLPPFARLACATVALVLSVSAALAAPMAAGPFFSLSRNAIGERLAPEGAVFPEETYDYGVREAVRAIAREAAPGAVIVSDVPAVVAYYAARDGRPDLMSRSLSGEGLPAAGPEVFVIVQAEHVTFENRDVVAHLQRASTAWRHFYADETLAAQVFRYSRG